MLTHKKEIQQALRTNTFPVMGAVLLLLMCTAVFLGLKGQWTLELERKQNQQAMYDAWVNQGDKHPHSAAHYGMFAFKPVSGLDFLDIGIQQYTGSTVFLEAHKRNEVQFSAAEERNGTSRFGELTLAMIGQFLIPLFIIFLSYDLFTKEREKGTLKLGLVYGTNLRQLFLGKTIAVYLMVSVLFFPMLLLGFLALNLSGTTLEMTHFERMAYLVLSYGTYFLVVTLLCVLVAAFARNTTTSLMILIGFWILSCIVLPKAFSSIGSQIYPTPSKFAFKEVLEQKVKNGIDGHNPSDERLEDLKQSVLNEYGVETIEELPVNWSGIAMQAGEEYSDKVYDTEFKNIEGIFEKQNKVSELGGLINPYLAIRFLSMGLSGTDLLHHTKFAWSAEMHHRKFVKKMNKDMEINHKPGVAYAPYSVGEEMWSSIPPFSYEMPKAGYVLHKNWLSIFSLLIWSVGLGFLSYIIAPKVSKL
jgi:ABC-2 type transport system permease protein